MNITKLIFFILIPLTIFCQNTVLAEELPKVLYCPEKIECTKDKSIRSCKILGDHAEQWGNLQSDGTVKKGIYFFNYAESTYQQPYFYDNGLQCNYAPVDDHSISINVRTVSYYWDVVSVEGTKWMTRGYQAYCSWQGAEQTSDPKDCPVEPMSIVKINYDRAHYPIFAYANGVLLGNTWSQTDQTIITLYDAWEGCSDTGLCIIELMATINQAVVNVGSIFVDIDRKMKIVHVHSITGFEISHDEKANSIEIKTVS